MNTRIYHVGILKTKIFASLFLSIVFTTGAFACSDNEFEVCVGLCWCQPNSGTLFPDPRGDVANAAKALASGDDKAFNAAVGTIILKTMNCIGCYAAIDSTLDEQGKKYVAQTVGEGFLTLLFNSKSNSNSKIKEFAAYLVVSDDKKRQAYKVPIKPTNYDPNQPPNLTNSRGFFYVPDATCIVKSGNHAVVGWSKEFKIINKRDGSETTWPKTSLMPGDLVEISALKKCKTVEKTPQESQQRLRLIYRGNSTSPTLKDGQMKYFFAGDISRIKEIAATKISDTGTIVTNQKMSNRQIVQRGIFQSRNTTTTVSIPKGAKGFWTYVGYKNNEPRCARNVKVSNGIKASLLINSEEVDSTDLFYDREDPGFMYTDIPDGTKTIDLKNAVTTSPWCGEILWSTPTFIMK